MRWHFTRSQMRLNEMSKFRCSGWMVDISFKRYGIKSFSILTFLIQNKYPNCSYLACRVLRPIIIHPGDGIVRNSCLFWIVWSHLVLIFGTVKNTPFSSSKLITNQDGVIISYMPSKWDDLVANLTIVIFWLNNFFTNMFARSSTWSNRK